MGEAPSGYRQDTRDFEVKLGLKAGTIEGVKVDDASVVDGRVSTSAVETPLYAQVFHMHQEEGSLPEGQQLDEILPSPETKIENGKATKASADVASVAEGQGRHRDGGNTASQNAAVSDEVQDKPKRERSRKKRSRFFDRSDSKKA